MKSANEAPVLRSLLRAATGIALLATLLGRDASADAAGRVVDTTSGAPIAGAIVTRGDIVVRTDASGAFAIGGEGPVLQVRAVGHGRTLLSVDDFAGAGGEIPLEPFHAKAVYLSFYGVGSTKLRKAAFALIEETELNAVVIDVKGDRGRIPYATAVPLAQAIGADRPRTIPDLPALLERLRARGVYAIARIVVFKDAPLALARPELAVRTASGALWRDREGLHWTDPFRSEVRSYVLDVAEEAAILGFDEVQFDYVRFPDSRAARFSEPATAKSRLDAIGRFFAEARRRLAPYNVFVAADVFGYVCWNLDDTAIGQRLEELAPLVDYVSPMLYPSSFHMGIPGHRNPLAHPAEIVRLSLERAAERTGHSPLRFRPWIQAFRDYAFDRRRFGREEIRAQIRAAEAFGAAGWMLWNAQNTYSAEALEKE